MDAQDGSESADLWACAICTFNNPLDGTVCEVCGAGRPAPTGASNDAADGASSNGADARNSSGDSAAAGQGAQPAASSSSAVEAPAAASSNGEWACEACTYVNISILKSCEMCGTRRPKAASSSSPTANAGGTSAAPVSGSASSLSLPADLLGGLVGSPTDAAANRTNTLASSNTSRVSETAAADAAVKKWFCDDGCYACLGIDVIGSSNSSVATCCSVCKQTDNGKEAKGGDASQRSRANWRLVPVLSDSSNAPLAADAAVDSPSATLWWGHYSGSILPQLLRLCGMSAQATNDAPPEGTFDASSSGSSTDKSAPSPTPSPPPSVSSRRHISDNGSLAAVVARSWALSLALLQRSGESGDDNSPTASRRNVEDVLTSHCDLLARAVASGMTSCDRGFAVSALELGARSLGLLRDGGMDLSRGEGSPVAQLCACLLRHGAIDAAVAVAAGNSDGSQPVSTSAGRLLSTFLSSSQHDNTVSPSVEEVIADAVRLSSADAVVTAGQMAIRKRLTSPAMQSLVGIVAALHNNDSTTALSSLSTLLVLPSNLPSVYETRKSRLVEALLGWLVGRSNDCDDDAKGMRARTERVKQLAQALAPQSSSASSSSHSPLSLLVGLIRSSLGHGMAAQRGSTITTAADGGAGQQAASPATTVDGVTYLLSVVRRLGPHHRYGSGSREPSSSSSAVTSSSAGGPPLSLGRSLALLSQPLPVRLLAATHDPVLQLLGCVPSAHATSSSSSLLTSYDRSLPWPTLLPAPSLPPAAWVDPLATLGDLHTQLTARLTSDLGRLRRAIAQQLQALEARIAEVNATPPHAPAAAASSMQTVQPSPSSSAASSTAPIIPPTGAGSSGTVDTPANSGKGEKASSSKRSSVPCRYFALGACRYGDRCRFSHDGSSNNNSNNSHSSSSSRSSITGVTDGIGASVAAAAASSEAAASTGGENGPSSTASLAAAATIAAAAASSPPLAGSAVVAEEVASAVATSSRSPSSSSSSAAPPLPQSPPLSDSQKRRRRRVAAKKRHKEAAAAAANSSSSGANADSTSLPAASSGSSGTRAATAFADEFSLSSLVSQLMALSSDVSSIDPSLGGGLQSSLMSWADEVRAGRMELVQLPSLFQQAANDILAQLRGAAAAEGEGGGGYGEEEEEEVVEEDEDYAAMERDEAEYHAYVRSVEASQGGGTSSHRLRTPAEVDAAIAYRDPLSGRRAGGPVQVTSADGAGPLRLQFFSRLSSEPLHSAVPTATAVTDGTGSVVGDPRTAWMSDEEKRWFAARSTGSGDASDLPPYISHYSSGPLSITRNEPSHAISDRSALLAQLKKALERDIEPPSASAVDSISAAGDSGSVMAAALAAMAASRAARIGAGSSSSSSGIGSSSEGNSSQHNDGNDDGENSALSSGATMGGLIRRLAMAAVNSAAGGGGAASDAIDHEGGDAHPQLTSPLPPSHPGSGIRRSQLMTPSSPVGAAAADVTAGGLPTGGAEAITPLTSPPPSLAAAAVAAGSSTPVVPADTPIVGRGSGSSSMRTASSSTPAPAASSGTANGGSGLRASTTTPVLRRSLFGAGGHAAPPPSAYGGSSASSAAASHLSLPQAESLLEQLQRLKEAAYRVAVRGLWFGLHTTDCSSSNSDSTSSSSSSAGRVIVLFGPSLHDHTMLGEWRRSTAKACPADS